MLGDVLKKNVSRLKETSTKKNDTNAFWVVLRDIAKEEILTHDSPIDSDIIIPLYYSILCNNTNFIPAFFKKKNKSNNQERFRVIIRNIFSSNAFNPNGLANQDGIIARKEVNEQRKGYRVIYSKNRQE